MKMKIEHYSGVPIEEIERDPVYYCKSCLSLKIINNTEVSVEGDEDASHCGDCGGAAIGKTTIAFWVDSYRLKYGKDFLTGLDIPYNEECKHCALKK